MPWLRSTVLIVGLALAAGSAGLLAGRWWFAISPSVGPALPPGVQVLGIGDLPPSISRPDITGTLQSLDQFKGAPLVINFWATWCPPCVRELPLLDRWHAQRDGDGLAVLAIALEPSAAPVAAFIEARSLRLPVWLETPAAVDLSTRFGNTRGVLPYSVLLGADGRVLAQKIGEIDDATLQRWKALTR
jgi:thiol-disulfide isomerase/thioredoxin